MYVKKHLEFVWTVKYHQRGISSGGDTIQNLNLESLYLGTNKKNDPEHPYSLEELKVITEDSVEVDDETSHVRVTFTPTMEHCSMATIIGLCVRVKLMRSLPPRYKIDIRVAPGSHATEDALNKQLNDKERVAAALENPNLVEMVDECLLPSDE
ncbi:Protein AE7 [Cardamine amara subsp. amara]|uniref:Protein AE7 n=1 Tax=Cardamine amara subsp. amara TaxID=228776 RepID=A0ABD1C1L8_CARAN